MLFPPGPDGSSGRYRTQSDVMWKKPAQACLRPLLACPMEISAQTDLFVGKWHSCFPEGTGVLSKANSGVPNTVYKEAVSISLVMRNGMAGFWVSLSSLNFLEQSLAFAQG
eukprot:3243000-Pleurochrysis_carterae.AAC.1